MFDDIKAKESAITASDQDLANPPQAAVEPA